MQYAPVIIIVLLIILILILYCIPSVRALIKNNGELLDFLSIVSIVGLVISLSITIGQYNKAQDRSDQQRKAELHARAEALQSEIDVNLHACDAVDFCLSQENRLTAFERFHYPILEHVLGTGDLTEKQMRDTGWDAYQSMNVCNRLLDEASELSDLQYATPIQTLVIKQESINKRIDKLWNQLQKSNLRTRTALSELNKQLDSMKMKQPNKRLEKDAAKSSRAPHP